MIPAVAYAIYFTSFVAADTGRADSLWSLAVGLSLVISGMLSPWIGARADAGGHRRTLLAAATVVCGLATAALSAVGRGDVAMGIAMFVVAHVAATIGQSLYNSFLPLLSPPEKSARLSGLAWGLSYYRWHRVLLPLPALHARRPRRQRRHVRARVRRHGGVPGRCSACRPIAALPEGVGRGARRTSPGAPTGGSGQRSAAGAVTANTEAAARVLPRERRGGDRDLLHCRDVEDDLRTRRAGRAAC